MLELIKANVITASKGAPSSSGLGGNAAVASAGSRATQHERLQGAAEATEGERATWAWVQRELVEGC